MKTVIKISFIVMLLFVAVAGAAAQSVYLAEAKRNPFERIVFIDDVGEKFRYTAFYDGASQPQEDIEVSFHVDAAMAASYNREHGTAYRMLPRGSYEMETGSAEITRGSVSAPAGEILVKGRGHLKAFEKYILPVTVRVEGGNEIQADPDFSTVYYIVSAVPAPGEVACKQVGQLPSDTRSVFFSEGRGLIVSDGGGRLWNYGYTRGGLGKAVDMEAPENLKEMDLLVDFCGHHIIGLYRAVADGQLIAFPFGEDNKSVGAMEKVFGTSGYNIFSDIFSVGTNLYCRKPNGELMVYPLTGDLDWANSGIRSLGSGWNHPVIFGYENSLIAIDVDGVMWSYPILGDGQLGLARKRGTGWDGHENIVVANGDLLCVDFRGTVWRIAFDDKGFWAL